MIGQMDKWDGMAKDGWMELNGWNWWMDGDRKGQVDRWIDRWDWRMYIDGWMD